MDLSSFFIKPGYSTASVDSDPYFDFFLKCFKNSNFYCRYGGFFTSKNLELCAEGLEEFIKNNGTMQLVLTPIFTKEDVEAIKQGLITKEKKIEDNWIQSLDSIKDKFKSNPVRALSWMIAQDPPLLEIKLAIFKDELGNPLDIESIKQTALADQSVGVFFDQQGKSVSFSGIIKAGLDDEESIDITVHKNWLGEPLKEHVESDYQKFRKLWEESDYLFAESEDDTTLDVVELPQAVKQKLLDLKPDSVEEIETKREPKLYSYQKLAKDSWINHGGRGIFAMATGTGKTITAIHCIKEISKTNKKLFVVIACPTNTLVNQWSRELKQKFDLDSNDSRGGHTDWESKLQKIINNQELGRESNNIEIFVTTYATNGKPEFLSMIEQIGIPKMFVGDEVHSVGSATYRKGLLEQYQYRLGLSATPERYFDDAGSLLISKFFKPQVDCNNCHEKSTVYEMGMKEAIDREFLVPYKYYPIFVDLTEDELFHYKDITRKLTPELAKPKAEQNEEILTILLNARARILKSAEKKLVEFKKILETSRKNFEYCLIYCASDTTKQDKDGNKKKYSQIHKAQDILNEVPILNAIVKSGISSESGKIKILDQLESGLLKCVLADKMLDEGMDIQKLKNAIVLSNDGNPKQYIQRRGRVLRTWSGTYADGTEKKFAEVFDIIVLPYLNIKIDPEFAPTEQKIVKKEFKRYDEMAEISLNPEYRKEDIEKIKKDYKID